MPVLATIPYGLLPVLLKAIAVLISLLLARGVVWLVNLLCIAPLLDPLKNLPGPDASYFQNHFVEVMDPDVSPDNHQDWSRRYGKTFRFHGFGRHDLRLMSFDFRVISHVLNSPVYEKPWQTRSLLGELLGRGIFTMEGADHKIQRKIIGPAFTTQSVKALTPIFYQKAEELRDRWQSLILEASPTSHSLLRDIPTTNTATLDVSHWLSRATFDAFGLAGLDYHFRALHDETEEVYSAYRRMFDVADKKGVLQLFFPIIGKIWPDEVTRTTDECLKIIRRAGRALVESKKATILAEKGDAKDIQEKDLLSLLIKSNLAEDPSRRLSDSDILDQITAFLFAGSDSTAVAISWCFHFLSQNPDVQARLRDEVLSIDDIEADQRTCCSDTHDSINALPLLDAVVRETLRLCPPVHGTIRVATADDYIPISQPVVLRNGEIIQKDGGIPIRKGSCIHVPIEGLNYDETIWGPDSREFKPDRWTSLPPTARSPAYPGLANTMTFSFGPHSCPGYKFTIAEMKAFISVLLPQFAFNKVEDQEIGKFNGILMRPFVKGQLASGLKLPIVLTKLQA